MAVSQTIRVYRGEQANLRFTMSPFEDITGWTLHFTVAKKANTATKLLGPLACTFLNSGQFAVYLTEEDLDQAPGSYFYDVWRTDEGQEQVLALGAFEIVANARVPPIEVI